MTEHDREQMRESVPDPESAPPVTIPAAAADPLAQEPVPAAVRAPAYAIAASALLPGSGHALIGEWIKGLMLLIPWGALLGILYWSWGRITGLERASFDDYLAIVTLFVSLFVVWAGAMWNLTIGRRRAAERGDSQWAIAARQFKRNRLAIAGLVVIILLYMVALLAPLIAPYDPIAQNDIATTSHQPPSSDHLLGTDRFGRDVLSRLIYGSRISLAIGFVATAISI